MAYGDGYFCGYIDGCPPSDALCQFYVSTYAGVLMCVDNQNAIGDPFITVGSNVIDNLCIPEC